jgi:hypothetical protein
MSAPDGDYSVMPLLDRRSLRRNYSETGLSLGFSASASVGPGALGLSTLAGDSSAGEGVSSSAFRAPDGTRPLDVDL